MIRRRLFNFAAAVSLILCVATMGLWARSCLRFDDEPFVIGDHGYRVQSGLQHLSIVGEPKEEATPTGFWGGTGRVTQPLELRNLQPSFQGDSSFWILIIPYWVFVVPSSILPLVVLIRWNRKQYRLNAVKWRLLCYPPAPKHISKEERQGIVREVRRRNHACWETRAGASVFMLGMLAPMLDITNMAAIMGILTPLGALLFHLIAGPRIAKNAHDVWVAHHLCPVCSYNLTANTSGTCPECGTAVPTPTDAKH